ncbi:MAG: DsbA family protein [Gammaproteobacteria bacterium]|nr:DsbA family protein [Gammaproteobacteria bacterium]
MDRILWYFADPMCSWCYGFSPVIKQLVAKYKSRIPISLIVGGLQPDTTTPISDDSRTEILHHWHQVHEMSGAEFRFDNALPEGFIYDTEPASRAAVSIPKLEPTATFPYFLRLQQAFYLEQQDITQTDVLANIAEEFDINRQQFLNQFASQEIHDKTQRNFAMSRQYGVRGFPTLILQDKGSLELLCSGYTGFEQLESKLVAWLEQSEKHIGNE